MQEKKLQRGNVTYQSLHYNVWKGVRLAVVIKALALFVDFQKEYTGLRIVTSFYFIV